MKSQKPHYAIGKVIWADDESATINNGRSMRRLVRTTPSLAKSGARELYVGASAPVA
jgi:hypothetical protein